MFQKQSKTFLSKNHKTELCLKTNQKKSIFPLLEIDFLLLLVLIYWLRGRHADFHKASPVRFQHEISSHKLAYAGTLFLFKEQTVCKGLLPATSSNSAHKPILTTHRAAYLRVRVWKHLGFPMNGVKAFEVLRTRGARLFIAVSSLYTWKWWRCHWESRSRKVAVGSRWMEQKLCVMLGVRKKPQHLCKH